MTRRLLWYEALGSTIGAGAIGAASIVGAACIGAACIGIPESQELQPLSQPESQPESHPQSFLHENSLASRPHFLLFKPQPLSQPVSHPPHAGASSQPQAGSAHPHDGDESQPPFFLQLNSLLSKPPLFFPKQPAPLSHPPHAGASQPQAGSLLAQSPHAGASQPQAGSLLAQSPHAGASQPQAGSLVPHPPHAGASQPPDDGASQPHAGSVSQLPHGSSAPHAGSLQQEVAHPQPLPPSILSNKSKPKLWLLIMPRTRVDVSINRFMEPRLLVALAL